MSKHPPARPVKWAIEDSFPIVEINRLAVPERNAYKPIYLTHKWFARRASCVFRAILLGCLKPLPVDKDGNPTKSGAQTIMDEFYKDHTRDPDTNGKTILDPFMGGGTTVVEALRLGCKVIGIDLNPVAWFIVKTETTPVDIEALKKSFDDLANRIVPWSGRPLKETLLSLYKTTCPCCGNTDADIIYTFWVKSAICTNPTCHREVPLFSDFIVAAKQPSIHYYQDVMCPKCKKSFDWETDPATLIAERSLTVVNISGGAGVGRGNKRWAFSPEEPVRCPWCDEDVKPHLAAGKIKALRKKVPLTVLLCPHCQGVWQYRGSLPDEVKCPACGGSYRPADGNTPVEGKFLCACGTPDAVMESIRRLPKDQQLPIRQYAIKGFCPNCAGTGPEEDEEESVSDEPSTTYGLTSAVAATRDEGMAHSCRLTKNKGKFFKRVDPSDVTLFGQACSLWGQHQHQLPHPTQQIERGEKTKTHLLGHHYRQWSDLFNPRQLLALASVFACIREESDTALREHLLCTASNSLEGLNMLVRYTRKTDTVQGLFSRHDFHPLNAPVEVNVWGTAGARRKTFVAAMEDTLAAKTYQVACYDHKITGAKTTLGRAKFVRLPIGENCVGPVTLLACDNRSLPTGGVGLAHSVVTDPPYVGNIQYAELSDFFYVWQRLLLADEYAEFAPEQTPKMPEISTNSVLARSVGDFERGLREAFEAVGSFAGDSALWAFTFHHAEGSAWESLLRAIVDSGHEIVAVYPIQGEREESTHLIDMQSISYDLIHVCKKRYAEDGRVGRSWAGIRQEIRRRARQEIAMIEAGRYGNEPLSPADVNIVLIGKCLELYSRHYGHVLDHEGKSVPLHEALEAIRMEVDQLVTREQPLPGELADIDPVSYVYFVCLADKTFEIKSDEVNKYTRGLIEPDELLEAGLIIKGRTGRGRYYKIKSPAERFVDLQAKFTGQSPTPQTALPGMEEAAATHGDGKTPFIDYVHFLIGLAEGGENLRPWMERFRGLTPQIRAACEYLRTRQPRFAGACDKILKFIEVTPLLG